MYRNDFASNRTLSLAQKRLVKHIGGGYIQGLIPFIQSGDLPGYR